MDVRLQAQVQWIEPSDVSLYQDSDNHRLSVLLDKPLYDFGLQATQQEQANDKLQAQQFLHINTRQKRRLTIMRRFFDALLADLNLIVIRFSR